MGLLDTVSRDFAAAVGGEARNDIDMWISNYLIPAAGTFSYGGVQYPYGLPGLNQTLAGTVTAGEIANSLPAYRQALQGCPPAFAAQLVRSLVLSQARFTFRNPPWHWATPRRLFTNSSLALLERPWPNATTGDLVARAEWHAGLAGNAFVYRQPGRLRVLRPDWTAVLFGSQSEPDTPLGAIDAELAGYVYARGGIGVGKLQTLDVRDVAHWAPIPDPEMTGLGMSWLTPAVRDMQVDRVATEHQIQFFTHGATPNLVVKGIPAFEKTQFDQLVEMMESQHAGLANAYKTLYLSTGADATVIGSNLKDLDLGNVQGSRETRIAFLSRVPAVLLGISEGLGGSSLNAGNFAMARRIFADTWVTPALQDLAASLASIMNVPADAELWFDTQDMPILREDAKDAADIEKVKADTINSYVKEGFTPESAIAAVRGQDITLLRHSGLVSVQLQPPGVTAPQTPLNGPQRPPAAIPAPAAGNGKAPTGGQQ